MDDGKRAISSTTDGNPPREGYENAGAPAPINTETGQHEAYWVLSEEERRRGLQRPLRRSYIHEKCGTETRMSEVIAETYAVDPKYYQATFCVHCRGHFPIGEQGEFVWEDGTKVGT